MMIGSVSSGSSFYTDIYNAQRTFPGSRVSDENKLTQAEKEKKEEEEKKARGIKSSPAECKTCKERKYKDGSDENVSFKSATHLSPQAAGAAVIAHEGEHVANAYSKAAEKNGEVLRASVSIKTAVCPECGSTYVAGGTTSTMIKYSDETNPYQKNQKSLDAAKYTGANIDYVA